LVEVRRFQSREIATSAVFTALVYITTSISMPMPSPLGVWHMGNLISFLSAILCGPVIVAFVCGIGAGLFDAWNPLWGSRFIIYLPATLVIRGSMGYLVGKIAYRKENQNLAIPIALIAGHIWKNVGYFLYDYFLYGAAAFLDLTSLTVKSLFEIVLTFLIVKAVRRVLGRNYIV
jgi:uncharacterized membrane protein